MAKAPFRPYDAVMAKEICALLACHPVAIENILAMDPSFPERTVFFRWKNENEDLNNLYIKSKQDQIECLLNEVNRRVLDDSKDLIQQPDGKLTPNTARVARDNLIMKNANWQASRLMPRLYGDRTIVDQNTTHKFDESNVAELEAAKKAALKDK